MVKIGITYQMKSKDSAAENYVELNVTKEKCKLLDDGDIDASFSIYKILRLLAELQGYSRITGWNMELVAETED